MGAAEASAVVFLPPFQTVIWEGKYCVCEGGRRDVRQRLRSHARPHPSSAVKLIFNAGPRYEAIDKYRLRNTETSPSPPSEDVAKCKAKAGGPPLDNPSWPDSI